MGRKKALRVPFTKAKIKSDTIFSLFAVFALFMFCVFLLSFYEKAVALSFMNEWQHSTFGPVALLFPFVFLMLAGATVQSKKLRIIKARWFIGYTLAFFGLLLLFQAGDMGEWLFGEISGIISVPGAYIAAITALTSGIIIAFELSIHDILLSLKKTVEKILDKLPTSLPKLTPPSKSTDDDFVGKGSFIPPKPKPATPLPVAKMDVQDGTQFHSSPTGVKDWKFPPLTLLDSGTHAEADRGDVKKNSDSIEEALDSFGVRARVADINYGPAVTQYALQIAKGVNVNKITALSSNLALALAAPNGQIRIEAPIPGKSLVGIEVPNVRSELVTLRQMITTPEFSDRKKLLRVPLGLNVSGEPISIDLDKMPHILVAGTTGSGKSICLMSWISTILFRSTPDEVKLVLIDPKRVTFSMFDGVPHLLTNIITDIEQTLHALKWSVKEMEERYRKLQEEKCTDIYMYNEMHAKDPQNRMSMIVIMIDELADLMMVASKEVEDAIMRVAQKARAVGMYLVLATQSPRVDVITGLMKANIPARVAFNVSSMIDSRVIIDNPGAEKLLGKGDMLFLSPNLSKPVRIQAPFVSADETKRLVQFFKEHVPIVHYTAEITEGQGRVTIDKKGQIGIQENKHDPMFMQAVELVLQHRKASTSFLQRYLSLGYSRAARLMDELEGAGVIGPSQGSKPRDVLIHSIDELSS